MTHHEHGDHGPATHEDTATHWDERYRERDQVWSGEPNVALVASVSALAPGTALDLGCGEGGDAVWLAGRGWTVTAVDVSAVAVERGRVAATALGIPTERIEWLVEDLTRWRPPIAYDLVSACFLHSMIEFSRADVLRAASGFVAPGGRLLVVGHAEPPPWTASEEHDHEGGHHHHTFLDPTGQLAELDLDPSVWTTVVAELRDRAATSPDGQPVTWRDSVVLLRRS